jgi:hypothetical protein
LTITTQSSTPAGSYSITVTGRAGDLGFGETRSTRFTLNVPFDFSIANSGTIKATQGFSGINDIIVNPTSGSSRTVTLSCTSGLPSGASCSFNPVSGTPAFTSILTITTQSSTPLGSYNITVTGTSGNVARSTHFTFTVLAYVGGFAVPADKLALLAPFVIPALLIVGATIGVFCVRRTKHKEEKQ